MSHKSPIFPLPESQHFSDYGFDPQIDYFQVSFTYFLSLFMLHTLCSVVLLLTGLLKRRCQKKQGSRRKSYQDPLTRFTSSFRNPSQEKSPRSRRPSITRLRRNAGGETLCCSSNGSGSPTTTMNVMIFRLIILNMMCITQELELSGLQCRVHFT